MYGFLQILSTADSQVDGQNIVGNLNKEENLPPKSNALTLIKYYISKRKEYGKYKRQWKTNGKGREKKAFDTKS